MLSFRVATQAEYRTKLLILGPKLIFVTGLVTFVTAVARLVCPDLLGYCLSRFENINFGPSIYRLQPNSSKVGSALPLSLSNQTSTLAPFNQFTSLVHCQKTYNPVVVSARGGYPNLPHLLRNLTT